MAGLPDPSLLKEIEYRAVEMARETGLFLTESQMTPGTVEYKGRGRSSPVTPADREAEERLRRSIQQRFPGHSILGEEGEVVGSDGAPFLWVLDPLDGTSNFIGRLAVFAVSVGVLYEGVPVAAALFLPASSGNGGRVYHARRDGGAFAEEQPIAVASLATPEDGRLVAFPAHYGRRFGCRQRCGADGARCGTWAASPTRWP
ncbi:MAG: hypothetical protein HYU29_00260 [Chloroflexi bacterium]|nr:hypothetical protein [Chloroflexota bacterium]